MRLAVVYAPKRRSVVLIFLQKGSVFLSFAASSSLNPQKETCRLSRKFKFANSHSASYDT